MMRIIAILPAEEELSSSRIRKLLYEAIRRQRATGFQCNLGAQDALVPHHVRYCLGRWITSAPDWFGRRLSHRNAKESGELRRRLHAGLQRTRARARGQPAFVSRVLPELPGLCRHPRLAACAQCDTRDLPR